MGTHPRLRAASAGLLTATLLTTTMGGCGSTDGATKPVSDSAVESDSCAPDTCAGTCCEGSCVDIWTDTDNCGGCGITCLASNADTTCDVGACALGDCEDGWGDCDEDAGTGCEESVSCTPGDDCVTPCGSTGSTWCGDPCAPSCVTLDETCNAQDDDCNGDCDEGAMAGCRAGVYRSSGALGHVYGLDDAEAAALGQTLERSDYFHVYANEAPGLALLYRCDKGGGRRFLTLSATCEIGVPVDLVVGWVATSETCGSVPLYRLYSAAASNHFYTLSAPERDNAIAVYGYLDEGVAAYVWAAP